MAKSTRKKKGAERLPAAPQMSGDTTVANLDRDRVAARAYELYQARGGGDGFAMDDWLAAEREFEQAGRRGDGQS
jgi:hypothetical protein